MKKCKIKLLLCFLLLSVNLCSCGRAETVGNNYEVSAELVTLENIPAYHGLPYVEINGNIPNFDESDESREVFESYSELDSLGRCGVTFANIGKELMPTEKRGEIGHVKPSGWQIAKYDFVDGKYLYNRCHLIGYQLSGENANECNLITGTRYMNVEGMLPFENEVAEYVKDTDNHVLYRVTPIFEGDNLIAGGVQMEAKSIEDNGEGICFNVYVYNCQPGVIIDYRNGQSTLDKTGKQDTFAEQKYILNTNTDKFHKPDCSSAADIKKENKAEFYGSREELIKQGYSPCGNCKP